MKTENIGPNLWWLFIIVMSLGRIGWDGIKFVLTIEVIAAPIILLFYYTILKPTLKHNGFLKENQKKTSPNRAPFSVYPTFFNNESQSDSDNESQSA